MDNFSRVYEESKVQRVFAFEDPWSESSQHFPLIPKIPEKSPRCYSVGPPPQLSHTRDIIIRPNTKIGSGPVVILYKHHFFSKGSCSLTYPQISKMTVSTYNSQLFKYRIRINAEFGAKLDIGPLFNYQIGLFRSHKISSMKM